MTGGFSRIKDHKGAALAVKAAICFCILFMICRALSVNGLKPYISFSDHSCRNSFTLEQGAALNGGTEASQCFTAEGNILDSVSVYLSDAAAGEITVSILAQDGREMAGTVIDPPAYKSNAWNTISGLKAEGLKKGREYILRLSCGQGLSGIMASTGPAPEIFGECAAPGAPEQANLAVGFHFTNTCMTAAGWSELLTRVLFALMMGLAMCLAVFRFGDLAGAARCSWKKEALPGALYFSVSAVLLFNPIEKVRLEAAEFKRVIGQGLMASADVAKRTAGFFGWFLFFAAAFILFYLLINRSLQEKLSREAGKCVEFLKDYMILADCCLLVRAITFFRDENTAAAAAFDLTSGAMMLAAVIMILYPVLKIDRRVSFKSYGMLQFTGACLGLPLAVSFAAQWGEGRLLFGIWCVIAALITALCLFFPRGAEEIKTGRAPEIIFAAASLLPLITSVYIEMIHILNQHEVFITDPAGNYRIMTAVILALTACAAAWAAKGKGPGKNSAWKWSVPVFVFGAACLSVQIPLSMTFSPSSSGSAGAGVLISDFLHFGKIPVIEHYGGQMMSSVWAGILYGLINGDHYGAFVSPYASLAQPLLAVLFYFLVREVWDEKMAVFAALLFPFGDHWNFYGWGVLAVLAGTAYIRKNTWPRAALVWGAAIWCAACRPDLGAAVGIAVIISMITWMIVTKNKKAAKQLGLTLAVWVLVCGAAWSVLCIVKGIHPVSRLREFLTLGLLDVYRGPAVTGDSEKILFAWSYLVIPFLVMIGLAALTFSGTLRKKAGMGKWILLLILVNVMPGQESDLTGSSIVQQAAEKTSPVFESWEQAGKDPQKVKRVELDPELTRYAGKYKTLFDVLLKEKETFVDFINRPLLYPILEKEAPAYVSLSPLQLPGEFAQEEFIRQIGGIPLVLMPVDEENYENSASQDGITNLYRNYKVGEYIFQHYAPLCRYGEDYALWCHYDLLNGYRQKIKPMIEGTDYLDKLPGNEMIRIRSLELIRSQSGSVILKYTGRDPMLYELQKMMDISGFIGSEMQICIDYTTDTPGEMQLYYTSEKGESHSRDKVVTEQISGSGSVVFTIPVTEFTRIRLDTPEGSTVELKTLTARSPVRYIEYGYDGPKAEEDGSGNVSWTYAGFLHHHELGLLPRIWAEADRKNAAGNEKAAETVFENGEFTFDPVPIDKSKGNYFLFTASYDGNDADGLYEDEDEQTQATVVMGKSGAGGFEEKCRYDLTLKEGTHDYLVRCSTDYYWYLNQINAVRIVCGEKIYDLHASVLEGD